MGSISLVARLVWRPGAIACVQDVFMLCRDGVVIGSDSASTSTTRSGPMGFKTIETPSKKITIINDQIIVSGSGEVGLHQRFCYIMDAFSISKIDFRLTR